MAMRKCQRKGHAGCAGNRLHCSLRRQKTYIQSAYALGTEEKAITENKPFALTGDSFPKIIVRHDIRKRWYDDNGILNISVIDFLLDDTLV